MFLNISSYDFQILNKNGQCEKFDRIHTYKHWCFGKMIVVGRLRLKSIPTIRLHTVIVVYCTCNLCERLALVVLGQADINAIVYGSRILTGFCESLMFNVQNYSGDVHINGDFRTLRKNCKRYNRVMCANEPKKRCEYNKKGRKNSLCSNVLEINP